MEVKKLTDFHGRKIKLNSYLVDFYKHGIYDSILNENNIREDAAFENLKDFKLLLENLSKIYNVNLPHDPFVTEIKEVFTNYSEIFQKTFDNRKY